MASPDEKYAIIVPGISKTPSKSLKNIFSKTDVYLLNVKTLKIKGTEKRLKCFGLPNMIKNNIQLTLPYFFLISCRTTKNRRGSIIRCKCSGFIRWMEYL